jgi:Putative Flp pilus-assembly TadE/G-like
MLVALFALAGLAIDASNLFSVKRGRQNWSDAAALAGAQELTRPVSGGVSDAQGPRARFDAMTNALQNVLGRAPTTGDYPDCGAGAGVYTSDFANCLIPVGSGTYAISMNWPAMGSRSRIRAAITQRQVPFTFARVLGLGAVDVSTEATAGYGFGGRWAILTLKHDDPAGIFDTGGTAVKVINGDMGGNGSFTASGTGTNYICLPDGASLGLVNTTEGSSFHYSTSPSNVHAPDCVSTAPPPTDTVRQIDYQDDPMYPDPLYAAGFNLLTSSCTPYDNHATTLNPGRYCVTINPHSSVSSISLNSGTYYFQGGWALNTGQTITGNNVTIIVAPTGTNGNGTQLKLNGGSGLSINDGLTSDHFCTTWASWNAVPTGFDFSTKCIANQDGTPMAIIVSKKPTDANADGQFQTGENYAGGSTTGSAVLNWSGSGINVQVKGVVYAPWDNANIAGGGSSLNGVGQIVAWTVKYNGGGTVEETYDGPLKQGNLRLYK